MFYLIKIFTGNPSIEISVLPPKKCLATPLVINNRNIPMRPDVLGMDNIWYIFKKHCVFIF